MAPKSKIRRTLGEALRDGAARLKTSSSPLLDARILLRAATQIDDAELIARSDAPLSDPDELDFDRLVARRARGEPVAYILGEKEFWSLPFKITPDVLIPRDDSECLIESILARRPRDEALTMLDLGAGSGCLICALMSEFQKGYGVGIDQSESAIKIARMNAETLGLCNRSAFAVGNWLAPVGGAFDIIIANPPYIADTERSALPVDVLDFEPERALFAGVDGMDDYRAILAAFAATPGLIHGDGLLVFEAGERQVGRLTQMVKETFQAANVAVIADLKGRQCGIAADFRLIKKRD